MKSYGEVSIVNFAQSWIRNPKIRHSLVKMTIVSGMQKFPEISRMKQNFFEYLYLLGVTFLAVVCIPV